jgi:UDP-N-acetylglucosamine 2-epimerase (non-hydrolysing)
MKIAPLQRELKKRGHEQVLVHTGQHYDEGMSGQFFADLGMEAPDYDLGVGSASQAVQTARVMEAIEPVIEAEKPDWVVVVGDVNSTLAAGLVAAKKPSRLAHVEAGIRSGNWSMPEEVNRVVVDRISDALFCFDDEAVENLKAEGIAEDKIHLTGDIMIDSLKYSLDKATVGGFDFKLPDEYGVLTLHRPTNVDSRQDIERAYGILKEINGRIPLVFPIHPRTEKSLVEYGLLDTWRKEFIFTPPLNYGEFIKLMKNSRLVLTDSGSIQQETTVMGIPCLTLRGETERAITVRRGTNELVGWDPDKIEDCMNKIMSGEWEKGEVIELWDGKTAGRVVDVFEKPGNDF